MQDQINITLPDGSIRAFPKGKSLVLLILILVLGWFFRIYYYNSNPNVWGDEAMLALNIMKRGYIHLANPPLDLAQYSPLGFLWIEKLITQMFGNNEFAFRVFPLLCGLLSLPLFYILSARFIGKLGSLVAVSILAFSTTAIRYSAEIKQYEVELLVTLASYFLYFKIKSNDNPLPAFFYGIIGGLCLWFSYPSVFVLLTVSISLLVYFYKTKQNRLICTSLISFCVWGVSFLLNYFYFIRVGSSDNWLVEFWKKNQAFAPFPPTSLVDLKWYFKTFFSIFDSPVDLNWKADLFTGLLRHSYLGYLCFFVGIFRLYAKKKESFFLLFLPLLFMFCASVLSKYPIYQRLLLFCLPMLIIFIAKGFEHMLVVLQNRASFLVVVAMAILIAPPLMDSFKQFTPFFKDKRSEIKRPEVGLAVEYLEREVLPGDYVYIHEDAFDLFWFYQESKKMNWNVSVGPLIRGMAADDGECKSMIVKSLLQYKGKPRVWFIMNRNTIVKYKKDIPGSQRGNVGILESDLYRNVLLENATLLHSHHVYEADVFLYDFR